MSETRRDFLKGVAAAAGLALTGRLPGRAEAQDDSESTSKWPTTAAEAAKRFGGAEADWSMNPDWNGSRSVINSALDVAEGEYKPIEWQTTNPDAIGWPQTVEDARKTFFPEQADQIDNRFIQEAWKNSDGVVIGWHFSEDHWIVQGSQELELHLPANAVLEGYTARATNDSTDDRNFVIAGPEGHNQVLKIVHENPADMQAFTIWMGVPPERIALNMELYNGSEVPHYLDSSSKQLGPIAVGWTPEHYTAAVNDLSFLQGL